LPEPIEEKKQSLIQESSVDLERVIQTKTLLGSFFGEVFLVYVGHEILNKVWELSSFTTPEDTGVSTIILMSNGSRKNKYVKAH